MADHIDTQLLEDALAASAEPRAYVIEHHPDHSYTCPEGMKGCKATNSAGIPCNKAKMHPDHRLPSLNLFGSGNRFAYQNAKKHWAIWLTAALVNAGLPRGLDSILVEGQMCFPTRNAPDQGNHRYFIEKALGDVLEAGGWLTNDSWDHYEFGNLARVVRPGERWLSLRLMPNALASAPQAQLAL